MASNNDEWQSGVSTNANEPAPGGRNGLGFHRPEVPEQEAQGDSDTDEPGESEMPGMEAIGAGDDDEQSGDTEPGEDGDQEIYAADSDDDDVDDQEIYAAGDEDDEDTGEQDLTAADDGEDEDMGDREIYAADDDDDDTDDDQEIYADDDAAGEGLNDQEIYAADDDDTGDDQEISAANDDNDEDMGAQDMYAATGEGNDEGDDEGDDEGIGEDEFDTESAAAPMASPSRPTALRAAAGKKPAPGAKKRRLSKRGAQLIAKFEGMRRKLYNDPAGHCTIGIGHLVHRGRCNGREPAEFKRGITPERAYQLLQHDAQRMEAAVNALRVPLNQNQFDALVSFTYNLGPGWTQQKTGLRDALRARRYRDVPRELNKWVYAGGKKLQGLVNRRKAEGQLFARTAAAPRAARPEGQPLARSAGAEGRPAKPAVRLVKLADVQPGKKNQSVLIVQQALRKALGLDLSSERGSFGARTQKAYAAWQRKLGFSGKAANGRPGPKSLKKLGEKYGFTVKAAAKPPQGHRVASPVPGHKVTFPYGRRGPYIAGYHTGDDYAAPDGTRVVAVRDGTIAWSKANNRMYGNWIGLSASNGRVYVYAHLSSRAVKAGQKVKAGQLLGKVGHTGNATGPHLHFEDHPRGPYNYRENRKPAW